jgi:hypothetical protein
MASNMAGRQQEKTLEFKRVEFDINEIAPDAPAGEWLVSIPRGKCKIQPTKEDKLPMVVVPIRLEKTDEDGEEFEKALGTELSVYCVFGGRNPRGERMAKLRIRQLCEAADVDTDVIPKKIESREDLDPFVRAIEGKKFRAWTILVTRNDTGETNTEIRFQDPKKPLRAAERDEDEDTASDEDEAPESERQPRGRGRPTGKNGKRGR